MIKIMMIPVLIFILFGSSEILAQEDISINEDLKLLIPIEYTRCKLDTDCTVIKQVCGWGWRVVNKDYQEKIETMVTKRNMEVSCAHKQPPEPGYKCVLLEKEHGLCEIVPDKTNECAPGIPCD